MNIRLLAIAAILFGAAIATPTASGADAAKVSSPGKYEGYSDKVADGNERTSFYLPMRDGTKLAVDLFLPTQAGKPLTEKIPVVWMHTPYNRRTYRGGPTPVNYPGFALELAPYGYAVAVVDFRGLYASYGVNGAYNRGEWLEAAKFDAYDITEWLAKQAWCNGNVGMWGCSATGGSQMQAATTAPPHLKAIFPMSCEFDVYPFGSWGGIPSGRGMRAGQGGAAVDADADGKMLAEAQAQHAHNIEGAGMMPFRDSISPTLEVKWWVQSSPSTFLKQLQDSKIPVYAAANWDEGATKYGAMFTFNNVKNPAKLIIGPQGHCAWSAVETQTGFDIVIEERRFFDQWLKGIDNGVMKEPPVYYFTYNAPPEKEWQSAASWPLPNQKYTKYYFGGEAGAAADKLSLSAAPETGAAAQDKFVVAAQGGGEGVYTTAPLAADVQMTGHPIVNLWIDSNANDVDVTATLEDIAPDGKTTSYFMNGRLRASHRAVKEAPYNNLGLPWHSFLEADAKDLVANEPAEVVFDLYPISYIFKKGNSIRLRVQFEPGRGVTKDNAAAQVQVHRGGEHASFVSLPLIPAK